MRWNLTETAFDTLLRNLDPERESAGQKYEQLHRKLEKFFAVHRCALSEDLADETINRVTRRLEEGEQIRSLTNYCIGVARMLVREKHAEQTKKKELQDPPSEVSPDSNSSSGWGPQLGYLDGCLQELPAEAHRLIVEYYQFQGHSKIEHRKALAGQLGIPLNGLRIRVHRIRTRIEKCVRCRLND
jgi:DNA-directed RNA polymerase specialized sigma24 family protein